MVKNSGLYPSVVVKSGDVPAVGLAGARLLTETIRVTSLDASLSKALSSWRGSWAVHDPGKIMADLAVCVALGGRCLSDVALLRCRGGGGLRDGGLRPHSLSAGGDPGRPRRGGRGCREPGPHSGAAAGVGPGRSGRPHGWCLGGPPVGDRRRRHLG